MQVTTGTATYETCHHCGLIHVGSGQCDRVKAIEYYPNGTLKRVEYHEPKMIDPLPVPSYPYTPWWQAPPWTCETSVCSSRAVEGAMSHN